MARCDCCQTVGNSECIRAVDWLAGNHGPYERPDLITRNGMAAIASGDCTEATCDEEPWRDLEEAAAAADAASSSTSSSDPTAPDPNLSAAPALEVELQEEGSGFPWWLLAAGVLLLILAARASGG